MRSAEEIAALYETRSRTQGPLLTRAREVRDTYNGDVVIPLPEISKYERSTVANLVQQGLDQFARRTASVLPNITCPPLRSGIKTSEDKADTRRRVSYGWWEQTGIRRVQGRRSRYYYGYAAAPVIIRPDPQRKTPRWDPFSPLDVFPAPTYLDGMEPADVILSHRRDLRWIKDNYPDAVGGLHKGHDPKPDDLFSVLEYIDDQEVVFVALGKKDTNDWGEPDPKTMAVELHRLPNRAGVCWLVNPTRPALDRPLGHFDAILGMHQTQAALTAMEIIAARKQVFPDIWLVNPNTMATPTVVQEPDYEAGVPGIVTNGIIDRSQIPPNFTTSQLSDRIEYAQRMTAGLPAEMGGMSSSNVRTARRGAQVLGAAVDFVIAEAHDRFAEAARLEFDRAVAIDKAYFDFKKSFYVSTKGAKGNVDYKPSDVFEADAQSIVEYPIAGTDLSDLVINGGQRVGMGTMSKKSFMEIDPLVSDADAEENAIRMEMAEAGFFAAWQAQMADPAAPWRIEEIADFVGRMAKGERWYDAVKAVDAAVKERQAAGAEPGTPEAMPGMAPPGAPGEVPTIGEPSPSMGNLTQLLNQLGSADTAMAMR